MPSGGVDLRARPGGQGRPLHEAGRDACPTLVSGRLFRKVVGRYLGRTRFHPPVAIDCPSVAGVTFFVVSGCLEPFGLPIRSR